MKKLTIYAMLVSVLISIFYTIRITWLIDTEMEFIRASIVTLVCEIGLWCAYYYARDYESIKAQEERAKYIAQQFMGMAQPSDEKPEQKQ